MVQLLHKLKIRASDKRQVLMKIIKNPISQHLPVGALRIGTSVEADLVKIQDYVTLLPPEEPICYVVGAHAHGQVEVDYIDREISISQYGLSASNVLGQITNAYMNLWNVL